VSLLIIYGAVQLKKHTDYTFNIKTHDIVLQDLFWPSKKAHVIGFSAFFSLKRNCVFSASSGSREKKIKSIQLILSKNVLALCINNYELISNNRMLYEKEGTVK